MASSDAGTSTSVHDGRGDFFNDDEGRSVFMTLSFPNSSDFDYVKVAGYCVSMPQDNLPCTTASTGNRVSARSRHTGGLNIAMGDGSVHFIDDNISLNVWQNISTMDDGEILDTPFEISAFRSKMTKRSVNWILLLIISATCCLGGCSQDSSYGEVSGTVTLDGKNVQAGSIRFIPIDGTTGSAGGAIIEGSFTVRVPVNRMRVEISAAQATGSSAPDLPALVAADDYVMPKELIPKKYNTRSELVMDVATGSNPVDYQLKSK